MRTHVYKCREEKQWTTRNWTKKLSRLLSGEQTMVIHVELPVESYHGGVAINDTVYLLENDGSGIIRAKTYIQCISFQISYLWRNLRSNRKKIWTN